MENKAPIGLGNMMKNALFVQKLDLVDTVHLKKKCQQTIIAILHSTRPDLLMGAQGKSWQESQQYQRQKKKLLQCHNNLINKQTNYRYLQSQSLVSTKTKRLAAGTLKTKLSPIDWELFDEFLWVTVKADVHPALSPTAAGWWSSQRWRIVLFAPHGASPNSDKHKKHKVLDELPHFKR